MKTVENCRNKLWWQIKIKSSFLKVFREWGVGGLFRVQRLFGPKNPMNFNKFLNPQELKPFQLKWGYLAAHDSTSGNQWHEVTSPFPSNLVSLKRARQTWTEVRFLISQTAMLSVPSPQGFFERSESSINGGCKQIIKTARIRCRSQVNSQREKYQTNDLGNKDIFEHKKTWKLYFVPFFNFHEDIKSKIAQM